MSKNQSYQSAKILEVNLFAFAYRLFHEDFSSIDRALFKLYFIFYTFCSRIVEQYLMIELMFFWTTIQISSSMLQLLIITQYLPPNGVPKGVPNGMLQSTEDDTTWLEPVHAILSNTLHACTGRFKNSSNALNQYSATGLWRVGIYIVPLHSSGRSIGGFSTVFIQNLAGL